MILYCGIPPLESYPGTYASDAAQAARMLEAQSYDLVIWNWAFGPIPAALPGEQLILVSEKKTLPLYEFALSRGCNLVIAEPGQPTLEQTIPAAQAQLRRARQNESYRSLFSKYGVHLKLHLWHDLIVEGRYNDLLENKRYRMVLLEPVEDSPPQQLVEEPQGVDSHRIIETIFPEALVILALQAQWEGVVFDVQVPHMEARARQLTEALTIGAKRRAWISPPLFPDQIHGFYTETLNEAVRRNSREHKHTVSKLISEYIETHLGEKLTRKTVSHNLFFSPDYLAKVFQAETGMTLGAYIHRARLERAKELLKKTDRPIGTIALEIGHQNFAEFSQWFKKCTEMTPSQYRKTHTASDGP